MFRTIMISTILSLGVLISPPVAAVDAERLEAFEQRLEEAKGRLELTDEQVELVTPIMRSDLEAKKAVLESYGLDLENPDAADRPRLGLRKARSLSREVDAIRSDTLESLATVLSPEQLKEYERMQEENREQIRAQIRSRR